MPSYLAVEQLAALVKTKRGKRGLREIAEEIGNVSASTLSRIEKGKMPDLDTFLRLCDWLEVSPDQFFENTSSREKPDLPHAPGARTVDAVTAHLRADKELDPETAEALANMVRAAYDAIAAGKLGRTEQD